MIAGSEQLGAPGLEMVIGKVAAAASPHEAVRRRCFVAALPDAATIDALIPMQQRVADQAGWVEAGRIHPDDLHLTLAFLGDRDVEACDRVARALAELSLAGLETELSFRGTEVWGHRQRVCVAVFANSRAWTPVLDRVFESLECSGWTRPVQGFRPHVTLWRARGSGTPKRAGQGGDGTVRFAASAMGLMARDESSCQRRYRTLWRRVIAQTDRSCSVG